MKNIHFKRKDSVFRSLEEEKKQRFSQKINWDKILYLMVLFSFFLVVSWYLFNYLFYLKADGQVLFKKISIQNMHNSRIVNLRVREGDRVCKGDTLFLFVDEKDRILGKGSVGNSDRNVGWYEKEIYNLEQNISLNINVLKQIAVTLASIKKELAQAHEEVILDILPKSVYTAIENKQHDLEGKRSLLKNENYLLQQEILKLRQQLLETDELVVSQELRQSIRVFSRQNEGSVKAFLSPMDGIVTQLFKEENEVVTVSEVIMFVHRLENVFIKAFFKQKDLAYVRRGKRVQIVFPDGTVSSGIIVRNNFSTYQLPEEFQKKFEPTSRRLSADIIPLDSTEFLKWHKFYKISVIINLQKY
jgi:multidrug resistance efflux pump